MRDTHYLISGGSQGRERLRLLARVMRPTTLGLFQRLALRSGMRCLDVGCGGGDVAFDLARIVGTEGRVVAVDVDETQLELARHEAAAQQLDNIEFRKLEIGADALRAGFDVVYARYLLTHLQDPLAALAKMRQALQPGGVVIVEDIDFTGAFCHPASTAYQRYVDLYSQAARQRGGDPNIGPKLPGMLADAGLVGIGMNVVQPAGMEGEVKLVGPITMENILDAILAAGLASRADVEQIIAELYDIARDPRTVVSLPRVIQAWGCRPDSA